MFTVADSPINVICRRHRTSFAYIASHGRHAMPKFNTISDVILTPVTKWLGDETLLTVIGDQETISIDIHATPLPQCAGLDVFTCVIPILPKDRLP